mgnify:CR=1 FL=1
MIFEEVDLTSLLKELTARQMRSQGGGHINLQFSDPPPLVNAWREGLTVMFNNLIENAYVHSNISKENLEIADMHHVDQKSEYHRESSELC